MGQSLKSQSGASIVEIIITLVIIAVTALIIMSFSRNTIGMSREARGSDVAYISAEQKISELATKTYFDSDTGNDSISMDNITCYRGWKITDTCFIKRARVTVYFKSLRGAMRSIILSGAIN